MGTKLRAKHHLDVDPNDPRLNVPATANLSKLNDEPEAPVQEVTVTEFKTERVTAPDSLRAQPWAKDETVTDTTRLGTDPNDARLVTG